MRVVETRLWSQTAASKKELLLMLQRAAPDALLAAHRLRRAPYSKGQLKKSKQDLLRAAAAELFDSIESDAAVAADAVAPWRSGQTGMSGWPGRPSP